MVEIKEKISENEQKVFRHSGISSTHELVQKHNSLSTSFYVYGVRLKFCLQILIVLLLPNFSKGKETALVFSVKTL